MLPKLDTISKIRIKIGVTQKKLASMAGVSTSMINQVESGRSKPSYETAKRIFDSLATLEGTSSKKKAGDVCSMRMVKLDINDTLHTAVANMREFSISQVPVFRNTAIVGLVTEDGIVRYLDGGGRDLNKIKLSDVMETAPPIVDYKTPANALVTLIRITKCILVSKNSKIIGIITASDTLRLVE
ncbi:MAG: CBS domain protein [Cenarchaeum symbiont of Oopsacas minuta]|nr:CBS domain protein [Cenarchaeum symbiont of Oopsacas minuta]